MLIFDLLFFGICFFLVLQSADFAIRFSTRLARMFGVSDFVISFFIVAVISALPETIISLVSHAEGKTDVALMALLGGNIIDLTFVFGVLAILGNGIRVESQLMRKDTLYLLLLLLPLLLGIDGSIGRFEGVVLMISGLLFFYTLSIEKNLFKQGHKRPYKHIVRIGLLLGLSLIVMLVSADLTIKYLSEVAFDIGIPEIIVALLVIATGTCLPELIFSLQSVRANHDSLALGDILGVVIIDSTIVLGALALFRPIMVDITYMRVLGFFTALGACVLIYFIKRRKVLGRAEGLFLLAFYAVFVLTEFMLYYG